MKTRIVYYINKALASCFVLSMVLFTSCEEELSPVIEGVVSPSTGTDISEGYPGSIVALDGTELDKVSSITFRGADATEEVNVVFNPVLNSDVSIFFHVPFDEEAGSVFGKNIITVTNSQGEESQTEFTILQPTPVITDINPVMARPGQMVEVQGEWFMHLDSVFIGDNPIEWESFNSTSIKFVLPGINEGGNVRVVTEVGDTISILVLEVDRGKVTLISDFDGNGTHPVLQEPGSILGWDYWWTWGDMLNQATIENEDGYIGNYLQWNWDGTTTEGFMGGSIIPDTTFYFEVTDPSRVLVEQYMKAPVGTVVTIVLQDNTNVHFGYEYVFERDDWHLVSIPAADFGYEKDMDVQTPDPDMTKIHRLGYEFEQNINTPPIEMKVDNMRFVELYPE